MTALPGTPESPEPPVAQTVPAKSSRRWWWLLALPPVLLLLVSALLFTASGLPLVGKIAVALAPRFGLQLELVGLQGSLGSRLQIAQLRWQPVAESPPENAANPAPVTGALAVQINGLTLDWQPTQLLQGRLVVDYLQLDALYLASLPSETPATLPASLHSPLALHLPQIRIGALYWQDWQSWQGSTPGTDKAAEALPPRLRHLQASLQTREDARYQLQLRQLDSGPSHWQGELQLAMAAPFALQASLQGESRGKSASTANPAAASPQSWRISSTATGTLQHLALQATLSATAQARRATKAAQGQLQAELAPFAPLPVTAVTLQLPYLNPADWLENVPQAALQLALSLKPEALQAGETLPAIHGQLQLRNQAQPGARGFKLPQGLPVFELNSAVHWQAVPGVVAGRLHFKALNLAAGAMRLTGAGQLDLGGVPRFQWEGSLRQFDPAQWFAALPPGKLGADFSLHGDWPRLASQRQFRLACTLPPGQWLGQPLQGEGKLELQGEHLNIPALHLQNGPNQLDAQGRFGQPQDRLQVTLNAPALKTPWLQGDLQGQLSLQGQWHDPRVQAELRSQTLNRPATSGKPLTVQDLQLSASGQRRAHQVQLALRPAGLPALSLALQGSLQSSTPVAWQGQLQQLRVQSAKSPSPLLQLVSPVPLAFEKGIARMQEAHWQSEGGGQIQLRQLRYGQVQGQPLLQTQGRIESVPLLPWLQAFGIPVGASLPASLSVQADWDILVQQNRLQGQLAADLPDLAWLGPLLGPGYKTGGSLKTRLQLGGTLTQPNLQGKLEGRQLRLAALEYQTVLEQGQLDAEWQGNILTLHKLAFNSRLQNVPRLLQVDSNSEALVKTGPPGKLEASGQLTLAGTENSQGKIDIRMERLGVLQQPTQWLLLSGNSALQLKGRTLELKGRLVADAASFTLPPASRPRLSEDVHIRGQHDDVEGSPLRIGLDMDFDFGRNFYFQGAGLNTRLAGEIHVEGNDLKTPRAVGSIRTQSGTFDAYGRTLALERGILNFQGPPDNPGLNIRAVRKNLEVEAGVEVNGTVQRPEITLVSSPEVPDAEKLSWMLLGTGSSGGNENSSNGSEGLSDQDKRLLMTAASSLLSQNSNNSSGGVLREIQNTLGIDEFTIDSGNLSGRPARTSSSRVASARGFSSDGQSASSQIISVGKRLTSNLLLSYEQALGGTESIVKLTLSLGRRFSIVGRAGTDNALDLFYGFSFGR